MSIPVLTLREAVSYDETTGLFVWRERPIHHFKNDHKWSAAACQSRWNTRHSNTPAFTTPNPNDYLTGVLDGVRLLAHRAAWAYVTGEWSDDSIDHINGDRRDNRFANLRPATRHQQARNKASSWNSTSRFLGVSYRKERGVWRANIFVDGRQTFLGSFQNEEDAARAYDAAATEHFGEFARLNFPRYSQSS